MSQIITVDEGALRSLVEEICVDVLKRFVANPLAMLSANVHLVDVAPSLAAPSGVRFAKPKAVRTPAEKLAKLLPKEDAAPKKKKAGYQKKDPSEYKKPGPKPGFLSRPAPSVKGAPTERGAERSAWFMTAILRNLVDAAKPVGTTELRNAIDPNLIASELLYHAKRATKLGYIKAHGDRAARAYTITTPGKKFFEKGPAQPTLNGISGESAAAAAN